MLAAAQRYRLLLCPTLPVPSVKAGESYVDRPLVANGKPQADIGDWLTTAVFNILGRCPVMSVPSGFASTGVPTGLSIVGRTFDDVSVLRAAAAFEQARPWRDKAARRSKLPYRPIEFLSMTPSEPTWAIIPIRVIPVTTAGDSSGRDSHMRRNDIERSCLAAHVPITAKRDGVQVGNITRRELGP
jgi:hypothetical protein